MKSGRDAPRRAKATRDGEISAFRSALMARVKGKDTRPEKIVRTLFHGLGARFRLHRKDLPGSPDLLFPKHRLAVFVHGCFWHRHEGCKKASMPKTRVSFWSEKFDANIRRDRKALTALKKAGWRTAIIWECQTKDEKRLALRLKGLLPAADTRRRRTAGGGKRTMGSR